VTKLRNDPWLTRWLKSPEQMLKTDADAKALLDKYKVPMPNQNLSDKDIREFIAYFKWADENLRPKGEQQPQPAAPGTTLPPERTLSGSPGEVRPAGAPQAQSNEKGKGKR
jgi:nitrite reductase (NO-forming)